MIRSAQLIEELWNDPEYGPVVRARAKKKFGDIRTPEDAIAPVVNSIEAKHKKLEEQLGAVLKKLEERDAKEAEQETFRSLQSKVESAVSKFNLTEEGRAKMLDRMKETGNYTDPDAAAALIAHSAPPAPVSGPNWAPQNLNLFGSSTADEKFAALHKDPVGFMDSELSEFVSNPDKYVAETFGRAA